MKIAHRGRSATTCLCLSTWRTARCRAFLQRQSGWTRFFRWLKRHRSGSNCWFPTLRSPAFETKHLANGESDPLDIGLFGFWHACPTSASPLDGHRKCNYAGVVVSSGANAFEDLDRYLQRLGLESQARGNSERMYEFI